MENRLSGLDPRLVEDAVRAVGGVAFAEVRTGGEADQLRLVLWQDAVPDECAGRVEVMLRERFGVQLGTGDVRVIGYANPGGGPDSLRVIDLGETTWATEEPVKHSPIPIPSQPPADAPSHPGSPPHPGARPFALESVSVSTSSTVVEARVRMTIDGVGFEGTSTDVATDAGVRRAVAEATFRAIEGGTRGARYDVESTAIVFSPERIAIVVAAETTTTVSRVAGASIVAGDGVARAIAQAAINSVAASRSA